MFEMMQLSQFLFNLCGIFYLRFGLDGAINTSTKSVTGQINYLVTRVVVLPFSAHDIVLSPSS